MKEQAALSETPKGRPPRVRSMFYCPRCGYNGNTPGHFGPAPPAKLARELVLRHERMCESEGSAYLKMHRPEKRKLDFVKFDPLLLNFDYTVAKKQMYRKMESRGSKIGDFAFLRPLTITEVRYLYEVSVLMNSLLRLTKWQEKVGTPAGTAKLMFETRQLLEGVGRRRGGYCSAVLNVAAMNLRFAKSRQRLVGPTH